MSSIKRVNYLGRFTTLFILVGLSVSFLIIYVLYLEIYRYQKNVNQEQAQYEISFKQERIQHFYNHFEKFLITAEHNKFLLKYLKNPNRKTKENLTQLFKILCEYEKYITQMRYLDTKGQEIVRIERNTLNSPILLVDKNKLQNKSHRDYFKNTIKLKKGQLFVSKLNLNIENKKIEIPHKPVWRFAIPIIDNGEKEGIVIINVFAQYLLDDLKKSNNFEVDIYDQDMEVLVSSHTKNEWTRYLNTSPQIDKSTMIATDKLISTTNSENLYIGLTPKDWFSNFFNNLNLKFLFLILFLIVTSFVLAYYLSKIPKKLFDEIEEQQQMLIQQSKLSAMGEMTSMLAHQWRQPLNTVSVIIQEIEMRKSMDILTDEEFESLTQKIHETLNHMSVTIDNFRDFFKPSKEKKIFNIKKAIESSADILKIKLDSLDIMFEIITSSNMTADCFMYKGYEGEFQQVIINLINNAIEALEEQSKKKNSFIKVFLKCDKNTINMQIYDNAGGIDTSVINSLFEPYKSTKLEKNGSGMGLYMSKMIIEKNMGGTISALNNQDGALFQVILFKKEHQNE